ncbi:MAG TPA: Bcr/CflA family drug resistance efflux transporter [Syntrophus sp. (in: bacteria)]|nr:MAG: Bcr/CflA family drug resistance efflux transporter [Syntrophus sp. GWC2_56_31]HBB17674.1 Bcr/CflA family drug resistance efflux transporter [Syntrophus sp. (in: bacteria)]
MNQDLILNVTTFQPAVHWVKPLWWLAALLAALATLGPFAIDTYLPAFNSISVSLVATPFQMQQTLSAYLIGFSVMMLLHGALSDSFGRRPVILGGLGVFALASLICGIANHIGVLIAGRVLQGMSCGAGIVVGRAIVRDLFDSVQAQRLMSQITLFFGIAPAVAPIIGGWLLTLIGWRSIFWFMMTVAIVLCILAWITLPETLPMERRQSFALAPLARAYWSVLSDSRFLLLTIASGVPFSAVFIFILSAPTLLGEHLSLPPTQFFWLFVFCISGIMGGAWTSGRLAGRIPRERQIRIGFSITLSIAVANVLWHLFFPPTPVSVIGPVCLIAFGWSLLTPCITLMVLDLFPKRLGLASSLQAFFAGLSNAITAGIIAPLAMGSVEGLAAASAMLGFVGLLSWNLYRSGIRRGRWGTL